jgi:hypothetical protein
MAPAKFDDLCKPAKDVLGDDYQVTGYQLKSKAKTNFEGLANFAGSPDGKSGGVLSTQIDFNPAVGDGKATPAKLTWKFPRFLGIAGIAFDKLEMDKAGKMKLEASVDNGLHGVKDLKIDCKSGLDSTSSLLVGGAYTGIADAVVRAEVKAMNPADYTAEASYDVAGATLSLKSTKASVADIGARYASGPLTCSATCKKFSAFTFHGFYKASADLKVAATYDFGGKTDGAFAAGAGYTMQEGTTIKGKLTGVNGKDLAVSASVKHQLAKGTTMVAGATMPVDGSKPLTWGVQVSIE